MYLFLLTVPTLAVSATEKKLHISACTGNIFSKINKTRMLLFFFLIKHLINKPFMLWCITIYQLRRFPLLPNHPTCFPVSNAPDSAFSQEIALTWHFCVCVYLLFPTQTFISFSTETWSAS